MVCNKANCKHNTENCNAYIFGLGSSMLYYEDKLYISEFDSEVTINDEDDAVYKGAVQIREVEKDGSKVSILYSADEGAVLIWNDRWNIIFYYMEIS